MSTKKERRDDREQQRARRSHQRFKARSTASRKPEDQLEAAYAYLRAWMKNNPQASAADKRTVARQVVRIANDTARGR